MKNPDDKFEIINNRKIYLRDNTWSFAGSDGVVTP